MSDRGGSDRRPRRRRRSWRQAAGALAAVALGSCSPNEAPRTVSTPPTKAPSPATETARAAGVRPGPSFDSLDVSPAAAARALSVFRISCPALQKRRDASELTQGQDWAEACAAAQSWSGEARDFFSRHFEIAQIGDGQSHVTGYFEPRIAGSRTRIPGYQVPVYGRPEDLVEADLSLFSESLKGKRVRGRVEKGQLVPYHDRAAIEVGAIAGRGIEIGWAADPVDLFFLEIQGSGQLALPDGDVMRIGYAAQNGREYIAIGKLLKDRGLLAPSRATMQGIKQWLRAHPEEGRAVMRENKSYVFFREVKGAGPLGALDLPVTPRGSVAADPKFVPLGAPVLLATERSEANGLWIAQDTGGAIKGANRFDTFWGAGDEAARLAGGMSARGRAYLLLPKGSMARLTGERVGAPTS